MTPPSRQAIIEHLKVYAELGVEGVSRDSAWRARGETKPGASKPEAP